MSQRVQPHHLPRLRKLYEWHGLTADDSLQHVGQQRRRLEFSLASRLQLGTFSYRRKKIWPPLASPSGIQPNKENHEPPIPQQYPVPRFIGWPDSNPHLKRISSTEIYESLPHQDSLRLLEIGPGEGDTVICCHLHPTRLHLECPSYEALSYVWGDASAHGSEILCNGKAMKVTSNLKDALQRLRLKTCSRLVWADAICINQEDTQERAQQVRMMSEIYERAKRVIVWLGPGEEHTTPKALSVICNIVNTWHHDMYGTRPANFVASTTSGKMTTARWSSLWTQTSTGEVPSAADVESWWAVRQLFSLDWFWRLWVIQEVALNPSVLVIWGESEIAWKWIGLAASLIRTNHYQFLQRYRPAGVYNAYFMYRISAGKDAAAPLLPSFSQLLKLTRQFESKDPRDRIFGLLGLKTGDNERGELFIKPDYDLRIERLYTDVAKEIILRSGSLDILSSVQHSAISLLRRFRQLPSWVPDWTSALSHTLSPQASEQHSANKGHPPKRIEFDGQSDILLVNGVEVDIISEVLPVMSGPRHLLPISIRQNGPLRQYFRTEEGIGRLARTMTAGKDWYGGLISDPDSHVADFAAYLLQPADSPLEERFISPIVSLYRQIMSLHRWGGLKARLKMLVRHSPTILSEWYRQKMWQGALRRKYGLRELGKNGDVDRFLQAASTTCPGRRMFVTAGGCLGLGPEAMMEGDKVCILFGASVPFVLRSEGGRDSLVGECYVEELMRGSDGDVGSLGDVDVMTFRLH